MSSIFRVEKQVEQETNVKAGGIFFGPEDGGHVPLKRRLTSNGLHGVISQKMVLLITTAV
jgi:hypothetical protein